MHILGYAVNYGVPDAEYPRCENGQKHSTCTFQESERLLLRPDAVDESAQSKDR